MSIRPTEKHLPKKKVQNNVVEDATFAEAGMSLQRDSTVGERLRFGEFELAPVARVLWRRGKPVKLGSRALDILIILASRPGEVLSKDELTKLVWRGTFVDGTALRVGVSAVRKALGKGGDRYIATIPGRGYCFILEVETTPAMAASERSHPEELKPHRLPGQIARVVGREEVIAALATEAARRRLLSLVGSGGIGKTTVAVAVAERLRTAFDAIAFVELAPIQNGAQMSAAVIAALGLTLRLQENPVDEIAAAVGDRRVLIVIDNCEHVVDVAAGFVEDLLSSAPGVTILATSRERLRVAGEWVHQLSPLGAPPESSNLSAEAARGYPAVEMFEERAAFALGGYQISDGDAPYVAEICRRLDGIALAIELAAGRLPGLVVSGLAKSLEESFSILTHGRRTALPRHQTLRATLDWSYSLLSPEDQTTLRRLSVFSTGFTAEDAAFLMGVRLQEANERLTSLLDKSLVVARPEECTFRYRLLDATRAYGQDKLEENGEANPPRRRHALRFLQVCRDPISDEEGRSSLRQATADIRAALDWSLARGGDLSLGVDLASAATPVFLRLGLLRQHRKYLDLALAHISGSADIAPMAEAALRSEMALRTAVALAEYYTEGQMLAPERELLRAREIARNIGDKAYEFKVLWMLYGMAGNVGSYRLELLYAQLFETTARESADSTTQFRCDRMLARALSDLGRHALAQQHVEQALRSGRAAVPRVALHAYEIDDWIAARATLARTLWLRGNPDDAKTAAEQCIAEAMQLGHEQSTCWAITFNICPVAIWRGDFGEAETLVGILLERSQQVFQHYHEWGLRYQRFLVEATSASRQEDGVWHSDVEPEVPAQADLFATFDGRFVGPTTWARVQADENIWCAPELLRASACGLVSGGDKTEHGSAEAMLRRSLDLAKRQEARAWELRSATSLASLYLRSSRDREARAVLEPAIAQFQQGHDTRDVQAATNILRALN
jgi:predicted ATPase/DNA-binding winged helix-turn-helix (wHTH) protein